MTDLELIFTMLGDRVTTEISQTERPKKMVEHKKVARRGGNVAGKARKLTEKEIGKSVISKDSVLSNGNLLANPINTKHLEDSIKDAESGRIVKVDFDKQ
jgi:hypothetical protein